MTRAEYLEGTDKRQISRFLDPYEVNGSYTFTTKFVTLRFGSRSLGSPSIYAQISRIRNKKNDVCRSVGRSVGLSVGLSVA